MLLYVLYLNTKLPWNFASAGVAAVSIWYAELSWVERGFHVICCAAQWGEHVPSELSCLDLSRSHDISGSTQLQMMTPWLQKIVRGRDVCLSGFCKVAVTAWRGVAWPGVSRLSSAGWFSWEPESGLRQNCCTKSGKHLGKTVFTYLLFYCKSGKASREENLIVKHETFWPGWERKQRKVKHQNNKM